MKRVFLIMTLILGIGVCVNAQRVRARIDFPVNITIGAPGPPPFAGAIWIGPEWRWQQDQYVAVPGLLGKTCPTQSMGKRLLGSRTQGLYVEARQMEMIQAKH